MVETVLLLCVSFCPFESSTGRVGCEPVASRRNRPMNGFDVLSPPPPSRPSFGPQSERRGGTNEGGGKKKRKNNFTEIAQDGGAEEGLSHSAATGRI